MSKPFVAAGAEVVGSSSHCSPVVTNGPVCPGETGASESGATMYGSSGMASELPSNYSDPVRVVQSAAARTSSRRSRNSKFDDRRPGLDLLGRAFERHVAVVCDMGSGSRDE